IKLFASKSVEHGVDERLIAVYAGAKLSCELARARIALLRQSQVRLSHQRRQRPRYCVRRARLQVERGERGDRAPARDQLQVGRTIGVLRPVRDGVEPEDPIALV